MTKQGQKHILDLWIKSKNWIDKILFCRIVAYLIISRESLTNENIRNDIEIIDNVKNIVSNFNKYTRYPKKVLSMLRYDYEKITRRRKELRKSPIGCIKNPNHQEVYAIKVACAAGNTEVE